jgi:hypothetical protein
MRRPSSLRSDAIPISPEGSRELQSPRPAASIRRASQRPFGRNQPASPTCKRSDVRRRRLEYGGDERSRQGHRTQGGRPDTSGCEARAPAPLSARRTLTRTPVPSKLPRMLSRSATRTYAAAHRCTDRLGPSQRVKRASAETGESGRRRSRCSAGGSGFWGRQARRSGHLPIATSRVSSASAA